MVGIIDIHCHILPGLDDGPKKMETSMQLLRMEYEQGVRAIIFTPHYRKHFFETTREDIIRQYMKMHRKIVRSNIRIGTHLGCECHSHHHMVKKLEEETLLTMAKSSYVLVEFSSRHNYRAIRNQIYELVNHGFQPIIAHIERYPCMVEDIDKVEELIDLGAYIQVNAGSVLGEDGRQIKKYCYRLIKKDWVHFIASDAHDCNDRSPNIGKCAAYIEKKMGNEYARKIFRENPLKIIRKS